MSAADANAKANANSYVSLLQYDYCGHIENTKECLYDLMSHYLFETYTNANGNAPNVTRTCYYQTTVTLQDTLGAKG